MRKDWRRHISGSQVLQDVEAVAAARVLDDPVRAALAAGALGGRHRPGRRPDRATKPPPGQRTLLAVDLNGEPLAPLRALKGILSSRALGVNTPGRIRAPRPIRFGCRRDHHPMWAFIDHRLQAAGSRCCPAPDQDSARRSRTTFAAK